MKLKLLPQTFAACKLADMSEIDWSSEFVFFSKTDDELSLVCDAGSIPTNATHIENGWRALRIEGVLDFSLVGILAKLSALLSENEISIFAVSTFNTDYILLKSDRLEVAVNALTHAGYEVIMSIQIKIITEKKKDFLDLLLLADEQENMIDKYLERGDMFALYDGDLKSVCVVTRENTDTCEVKNLATYPQYQKQGYAKSLLEFVFDYYKSTCKSMLVGTDDTPLIIPFYEKCGFKISHRIPNFFTEHYDHPIIEDGVQLVDMVYLKREL